ncbi:MAG: class I SAM-dependent methyltransferase [Rhodospirillales bacterium]
MTTSEEAQNRRALREAHEKILHTSGVNWNTHCLATLTRQSLSKILYLDNLYRRIVDVPGVIIECGVHFGATLGVLSALRGLYEPYNFSREIIGFDTFEGFAGADKARDGALSEDGDYSVPGGYEDDLARIMEFHESNSPIPHIKKFSLIKGDASVTVDEHMRENPHTLVSMAIFDMDIYEPTKSALQAVLPRLVKGSIVVFDELNCPGFPGETEAARELLDLGAVRLERDPNMPYSAWFEYGGA